MQFTRNKCLGAVLLVAGICWLPAMLHSQENAVPTKVLVRAVSKDANIIQTRVGGARIVIRDVETGKVLAKGIQEGKSGDTKKIMIEPRARGATVYDTPGAAKFVATLNLSKPTVVEISAEGPLGFPQATRKTTKTLLLVPGKDVLGEGVILEIHGFIVTLELPTEKTAFKKGEELAVRATVRMT